MSTKTVWVVATEHSPGTCSSSGFDWYFSKQDAEAAYNDAPHSDDDANFLYPHDVAAHLEAKKITDDINSQIDDLNAAAKIRTVGANVVAYWREAGFAMGSATEPAPATP